MIDVINLFACAGGTSTGFELARVNGEKVFNVVAAVDIDSLALASHYENWPTCRNFVRDITTMNPVELMKVRNRENPLVLWASPECTEFSGAKSGPKDAESHQLSESMYPFIRQLKPDVILVENVPGFVKYGPLDEHGIPIPTKVGTLFHAWHETIEAMGYTFSWRKLNAEDYGAHTRRERFFGAFVRPGIRFEWPEQTHSATGGIFCEKWRGSGEKLDYTDPGESVFTRNISLVDNSLDRIIKGVKKFVTPQVITVNTNGTHNRLEKPMGTIVASPTQALMVPFVQNYNGDGKNHSTEKPCPTITTGDRLLMATAMVINTAFKNHATEDGRPCPTIVASQANNPLNVAFITTQYGNGHLYEVNDPSPTITTSNHIAINQAMCFDEPSPHWEHQEGDTDKMRELRDVCREKKVYDIFFRMLSVQELKELQGFPADYKFCGTIKDQKSFIGKSVVPLMAELLALAAYKCING